MNISKYRSASNLYQVFITIERTPLTNTIIYYMIDIPKLHLSLEYLYKNEEHTFRRFNHVSKDDILRRITNYKNQKKECPILEINHFKIERNLIDMISSEDELTSKLGIEILVNNIKNVKLKLND